MNSRSRGSGVRTGIGSALAVVCLLAFGPVSAAPAGREQTTHVTSRRAHEVVSVAGIDRAARRVIVQSADGERRTITVPPEVRGFDTLKVGDNVEIDYSESIGISVLPPGTKPTVSERATGVRTPAPGAMTADRELTVAAEVVSVDPDSGAVSFRGPEGQIRTVNVSDPELQRRVASLKPGQVIQVSHRESIAASIQPVGPRPARPDAPASKSRPERRTPPQPAPAPPSPERL